MLSRVGGVDLGLTGVGLPGRKGQGLLGTGLRPPPPCTCLVRRGRSDRDGACGQGGHVAGKSLDRTVGTKPV